MEVKRSMLSAAQVGHFDPVISVSVISSKYRGCRIEYS